ncbi:MAG: TraB/GumN family protein, partial [Acidiferrobacteraceae bacterium]
ALAHEPPWALLITLGLPRETRPVLDQVLAGRAQKLGMTVLGLESAREQIDALRTLPLQVQTSLLRDTLDHSPENGARVLIRAYRAQNLRVLLRAAGDRGKHRSAAIRIFFRRLLHDRNRRMVGRLLPLLARTRAFVAVGALHLPGFLSRLTRAGYCAHPVVLRIP